MKSSPESARLTRLLTAIVCFSLASCTTLGEPVLEDRGDMLSAVAAKGASSAGDSNSGGPAYEGEIGSGDIGQSDASGGGSYEVLEGSGRFVNSQASRRAASESQYVEGDIVLNFEKSEIREVIDNILGDMLNVNYVVDPALKGTVSLVTSRPITRDAVLPTLETMLQLNGAVLSVIDGVYVVSPQAKRPGGIAPRVSVASGKGHQLVVVPLRYIAAEEMQTILQPMIPEGNIVSVDQTRNLIVLAGTQTQLRQAIATTRIFDVDQMKGMSIGFFRLESSDADEMSEELQEVLGASPDGPLDGVIRFVTISRLNALVVISPQQGYIEEAREWVERLDRADQSAGSNMYVYPVQNGRAENLASLLSDMFGNSIQTAGTSMSQSGSGLLSPGPSTQAATSSISAVGRAAMQAVGGRLAQSQAGVRIIADTENNALLILASRSDYAKILSAVRRLDVLPLQVLVEATIAEVSLTGDLAYGLQWFFKNGINDYNGTGELFPLPVDPSFSYTVADAGGQVRAVLDLLAADSRLEVVSSPSLMVLDNHTATIKVGDQVPIRTSETTSLATSGDNPLVTSTIQYRDTGVVLEVTPRVNPGGMVVLDITQDVNDVDNTTTSAIDSPTIVQRQITTSVAVQSGETVVLGGLIRENASESEAGIPGLRNIPGVGRLFSSKKISNIRTELLVLITPTALSTVEEAREATREMQNKLSSLDFGDAAAE